MYSFLISIAALILGYFLYGRFVDNVFGPDSKRQTPAVEKQDGIDYVKMPAWRAYMIQFLNIAGTGPIFGAIMGAKFGPSAFLWIVLGSIFAGGVHDYFAGMLSIRHDGLSFPNIVEFYLGKGMKFALLFFSLILMLLVILVGTVFVYSPALILGDLVGDGSRLAVMAWVILIFVYYIVATLMPIDKIIGKIYPVFAFALLFMALSLMVCLFVRWPAIPEVWDGLHNWGAAAGFSGMDSQPILPCLFITIACGAISGFHATQSPLMAKCITNEKMGRPIFYGAMITEGIVALVWAAVASYFFFDGGAAEVGADVNAAAPVIVNKISKNWLGLYGGLLAIMGVVAAPITSGDTAFRSARVMISDFFHIDQKSKMKRLMVAVPMFAITGILLWFNIADENGFNVIWRYFGWANQTLASFMLWAGAIWLARNKKGFYYMIAAVPGAFIGSASFSFICTAKIGFNLPGSWGKWIILGGFILSIFLFEYFQVYKLKATNK